MFFPDLQTFTKLDFHFDPAKEAEADAKGRELFSKSPYADKGANVVRFVQLLEARAPELPSLLRAQFDGDFGTSHLQPASGSPQHLPTDHPDQMAAQPLGSRIRLDPWSDKIEIIKAQSAPPITSAEKRPFEVSPFFPYLKRLEEPQAGPPRANP